MADKLRKTIPIRITFSSGEQPTAQKLTAMSDQIRNGVAIIEKAIGDIWNQSADALLVDNALQIPNLGRLMGQNEYLNPAIFPTEQDFDYTESIGSKFTGRTEGFLLFQPNITDTTEITVDTAGAGFTGTARTTERSVTNAGDYWIDPESGRFRTYTALDGTEKITYSVSPLTDWVAGEETLPGVIPDPGQGDFSSCKISTSGGVYYLHLPPRRPLTLAAREAPANYPDSSEYTDNEQGTGGAGAPFKYWSDGTAALTGAGDEHYRYQLPKDIQDTIASVTAGTQLPEGSMYIWDSSTSSIIQDVVFRKPTDATLIDFAVQVSSNSYDFSTVATNHATQLEADYTDTGLILITCGSPLSRALWTLSAAFYRHSHKKNVQEATISHQDLTDTNPPTNAYTGLSHNTLYPSYLPGWAPSNWAFDTHTSLLSRAGSQGDGSTERDINDNAMLGHLVLANDTDVAGVFLDSTPANSFRLYFGDVSGPSIWSASSNLLISGVQNTRITDTGTIAGSYSGYQLYGLGGDSGALVGGLYRDKGTDNIVLGQAAYSGIHIKQTGEVGIGSSPVTSNQRLLVSGVSGTSQIAQFLSDTNAQLTLTAGGIADVSTIAFGTTISPEAGGIRYSPTQGFMGFRTGSSYHWFIDSNGHFCSDDTATAATTAMGLYDTATSTRPYSLPSVGVTQGGNSPGTSWLFLSGHATIPKIIGGGLATDLQVGFDNGTLGGAFTPKISLIKSSGFVGIGDSLTPLTKLHVKNSAADSILRLETTQATDECIVEFYNETTGSTRSGYVGYTNDGSPAGANNVLTVLNEVGDKGVRIGGDATNYINVDDTGIDIDGPIKTNGGNEITIRQSFTSGRQNQAPLVAYDNAYYVSSGAGDEIFFACPCPLAGTINNIRVMAVRVGVGATGKIKVFYRDVDAAVSPSTDTSPTFTLSAGPSWHDWTTGAGAFTPIAFTSAHDIWIKYVPVVNTTILYAVEWVIEVDDASAWRM